MGMNIGYLTANKTSSGDEVYTPFYAVEPLLKYIPRNKIIWCPFDENWSAYYQLFTEKGYTVIRSSLKENQDFFEYEPEDRYDIVVSNPPFTRKLEVLDRLYKLDKPFAMVLGLPILNYQEVGNFFLDKELQLLIVDKKVSFDGNTASFNNSYFCYKFLPKDIIFEHLEHNNSKYNFIKSRMFNDVEVIR